jgi:hypothetical protein
VSVLETVLVFVCIPLGLFALFAIAVFVPGAVRAPRYRPGQPWEFEPVWFSPHPGSLPDDLRDLLDNADSVTLAQTHAARRRALPPGAGTAPEHPATGQRGPAALLDVPERTARGGAHGDW